MTPTETTATDAPSGFPAYRALYLADRERETVPSGLHNALDDLQQAEAEYRLMHDLHGDGSKTAGRAWDLLRRAGDNARDWLKNNAPVSPTLPAVLRIIDSCGGVPNVGEDREYTRGYNDALNACESEMKRAWDRIVAGEVSA